jgi:hypothetical protein
MQIDHSGGQSAVAHQHLDFSDTITGFQQMGGKFGLGLNRFGGILHDQGKRKEQ